MTFFSFCVLTTLSQILIFLATVSKIQNLPEALRQDSTAQACFRVKEVLLLVSSRNARSISLELKDILNIVQWIVLKNIYTVPENKCKS